MRFDTLFICYWLFQSITASVYTPNNFNIYKLWDPVHYDITWKKYFNRSQLCYVSLQDQKAKITKIQVITNSRKDRKFNCATLYQYCLEHYVNRQNCVEMSTKLIKRIEKKTSGCKTKDADQMDNLYDDDTSSGKRRTILSSRASSNSKSSSIFP